MIVSENLSDSEIIAFGIQKDLETDNDVDVEENSMPPPSTREVQTILLAVHWFYQLESNVTHQIFDSIVKLEIDMIKKSFTQLTQKNKGHGLF